MSDQPTPETDGQFPSMQNKPDYIGVWCLLGTLRRLERERDQSRELARELRDALTKASVSYTYSDEWRNHARRAIAKAKEVLP
jgi:hypothetical protein